MAFFKNFLTKARPIFTKMGLPQYKKKKKKKKIKKATEGGEVVIHDNVDRSLL